MSYCRWSTDDFRCDLYCYRSDDGYVTHVRKSRPVFKRQMPPEVPMLENIAGWLERHKVVGKMCREAEWLPIGLEHDGKSFCDSMAFGFLETLKMLREAGYHFPNHVIDAAAEEMKDEMEDEIKDGKHG